MFLRRGALILCLTLAACGGDPGGSDGGELLTGDTINPAAAKQLVSDFAKLDGPAQEKKAADLNSAVERAAWKLSGLEKAVGGPAAADTLFEKLNTASRATIAPMVDPLADVHGFGKGGSVRTDDLSAAGGAGLFGALMIGSLSADSAAGIPDGTNTGSVTAQGVTQSATKTSGTVAVTTGTTVDGVELKITSSVTVQPCPDASGTVIAEGSISASTNKGGTGHSFTHHAKVTLQVNDDAEIASSSEELRSEQADYSGGKGHYVDVIVDPDGGYGVKRSTGELPADYAKQSASEALLFGTMLKNSLSDAAEKAWKSGACVVLVPSVSAGPTGLDPSASVTITAAPRSKLDGGAVGGTVTAELTGGGASVKTSGKKVKADATFTYTAPGEKKKTGDVALEARSKRGVAKATLHFDTYDTAFHATGGGGDYKGEGTICSLSRPFKISGTGLTQTFTPKSEISGTYVLSGNAAGVSWSGNGTYTVKLNASRNSGTLKTTGTNTIDSPMGKFSDQAETSFALRSIADCD